MRYLALAVLFASAALSAPAQGKRIPPKKLPPSVPTPISQEVGLPDAVVPATLPPRFEGVGGERLADALDALQEKLKKDQFETTKQHEDRVIKIKSNPFIKNIKPDSFLAVATKESPSSRAYNADTSTMKIEYKTSKSIGVVLEDKDYSMPKNHKTLEIHFESTTEDTVFTNAYGAKVDGKKMHVKTVNLIVPDYTKTEFSITMAPEKAKSLQDKQINLIVVGKLNAFKTINGGFLRDAKISNPTEYFQQIRSIPFEPFELAVYIYETGEIIHREKISKPGLESVGIYLSEVRIPLGGWSILSNSDFVSSFAPADRMENIYTANSTGSNRFKIATKIINPSILNKKWNPDVVIGLKKFAESYGMKFQDTNIVQKQLQEKYSIAYYDGETFLDGIDFNSRFVCIRIPQKFNDDKLLCIAMFIDKSIPDSMNQLERVFNSLKPNY